MLPCAIKHFPPLFRAVRLSSRSLPGDASLQSTLYLMSLKKARSAGDSATPARLFFQIICAELA